MVRVSNVGEVREPPNCRDKACFVSTARLFLYAGADARRWAHIQVRHYLTNRGSLRKIAILNKPKWRNWQTR